MNENENQNRMTSRRRFLRGLGGTAAAASLTLTGCKPAKKGPETGIGVNSGEIPTDKMEYRVNPKNGDRVSLLGFGCMRLPLKSKFGSREAEYAIDQEAVNDLFDYAIAHGVNYFDTSRRYCRGFSEEFVGYALARHDRKSYFLATKMSNQAMRSREESLLVYRESLEKLQTDYFDYYLFHSIGKYDVYKERYLDNGIRDFLLKEREAGRIRQLGWSFHGEKAFFDFMMSPECGIDWDFVQIQLNYAEWERIQARADVTTRYLYDKLADLQIPAIIMEPLLGGRLASPNFKAKELMKQMRPEASYASWAFRFAGSLPNVLTILSGMTYMEHLQDNLRTFCPFEPLNDAELEMLAEAAKTMEQFNTVNCTGCEYCMPCPYGLDIPGIFTHFNKCLNEANFPENPNSANYKKARREYLIGFDRSVPALRQANHCVGCELCRPKCPQSIAIPAEMQRIDQFAESLRLERGKAGI